MELINNFLHKYLTPVVEIFTRVQSPNLDEQVSYRRKLQDFAPLNDVSVVPACKTLEG